MVRLPVFPLGASKMLSSHGRPELHKPSPATDPAAPTVPRLGLYASEETAASGAQSPTWASVGPSGSAGADRGNLGQPSSGWGWGEYGQRRHPDTVAPCALPRASGDAVGGAAGAGAFRNVLPHPGARSRRAAPIRVPGQSSSLADRAVERGAARDVAGALSPAAHTFLLSRVPQCGAAGVSVALFSPGYSWERSLGSSGLEGIDTGVQLSHLLQAK